MTANITGTEAAQKPMRAYIDDDGAGVIYVIDYSQSTNAPGPEGNYGNFVAKRGLDDKWRRASVTDGILQECYHLILDYDEVGRLVTEARSATMTDRRTARERFTKELSTNPRSKKAPKSGEG